MTVRPPNPDALVRWVGGADQQLRHLQTNPPLTWDNIRFENLASHNTDSPGVAWISFSSAFPTSCFLVVANANIAGPWYSNPDYSDRTGFQLILHDSGQGNYSGSFQVSYIALGF
jgi:hypothetical protein